MKYLSYARNKFINKENECEFLGGLYPVGAHLVLLRAPLYKMAAIYYTQFCSKRIEARQYFCVHAYLCPPLQVLSKTTEELECALFYVLSVVAAVNAPKNLSKSL